LFRDYERAFSEATRLPLNFHPAESWQPALRGKKYENPFCALLAKNSSFCAKCMQQQEGLTDPAVRETKTHVCFAGLCESSVPVRIGSEILGFLRTGQIAHIKPTKAQFNKIAKQIIEWGVKTDLKKVEEAYFHSRIISKQEYQAMLRLLEVFGQHLSMTADQIAIQDEHSEPGAITRAKEFINEHKTEEISLDDVAKKVNMSTFYFCKMFKKATGVTFTEYLSLVRVSKAKNLLLNPNLRISEIAFEVGFQSLTHFNRVFRKIVGQSPTHYRAKLPHPGI
jgi:AraC-like DNA-binding protein/ligand-binding sensor protein